MDVSLVGRRDIFVGEASENNDFHLIAIAFSKSDVFVKVDSSDVRIVEDDNVRLASERASDHFVAFTVRVDELLTIKAELPRLAEEHVSAICEEADLVLLSFFFDRAAKR